MKHYNKFNIIISTDTNGGFSYKNKLPWKFIKDIDFYNTITSSNVFSKPNILIMGRKTWESMNRSTPNRIAFVVTSEWQRYTDLFKSIDNLFFFPSFTEALSETSNFTQSIIWVVGGYEIYDEALKHENCGTIYHNKINGTFKTDRMIDLNSYNVRWSKIQTITDININDNLNYIIYFKKGFVHTY